MSSNTKNHIFSDSLVLYNNMLKDIHSAKHSISLETYIYDGDAIGIKFRDSLIMKAKQGVEVRVLVDSWGSSVGEQFFSGLMAAGGDVRVFKKFKFELRFFEHNHRRDHRKLLVIDEKIVYIGSTNITSDCLSWRELTLRMQGEIAKIFHNLYFETFDKYKSKIIEINKKQSPIRFGKFSIIRDSPSFIAQNIKFKYIQMINSARKEVYIETPYFVPDFHLRSVMKKAAKRGVKVHLILPLISDVRLADILRDAYLGRLHKNGIKIYFYRPRVMHSKAMLIDSKKFVIGSANLDYRSFMHQFEICVSGEDEKVIKQLKAHIKESISESDSFEFEKWVKRSLIRKLLERTLSLFKQWI